MEVFWRRVGVQLGKHWKIVVAAFIGVTVVLGIGLTRTEFATGQDSYLNPDSQIAIDNVEFQDNFGGETVILLFTAQDGSSVDVSDLFEGANLAELQRLNAELAEVEGVYAVVTPLTSVTFSHNLLSGGVGSNALLAAASRDADGAAARQADIGIAIGSGTDVAKETGDLELVKGDIRDVARGILLGRRTLQKIRQNLFWAFFYNVIGIPVAAGALYPSLGLVLKPEFAGLAMALSSVSVVTNSLLLKKRSI